MLLWGKTFPQILDEWDRWDKGGTDREGIRALALEDRFYLLVKVLKRVDCLHPWLYARCREVERSPDGYLDLWAREHYKSTLITFAGSIQEVLKNPNITIGIFSHTAPIAKSFLNQIKREFEGNQVLHWCFPDVFWANPWKEAPSWSLDGGITVRRNFNPKESTIEAHGLVDGQPISKHYALMVYDDVVVPASVSTPEQVSKTTEAWELSDNLGIAGGRKWHIGTRYSYADTYQVIMERKSVIPRVYPATENGQIDGRPVFFSQEAWNAKVRDQGDATIACQMLQNPLAGQQRLFNVEDTRVYEIRPETLNVYILVDPARSKKKESADTAMVVIGIDYAGNKYLLDGVAHKMDLMERWTNLRNLYVKWKRGTGVQSVKVGYESYGAQADLDYCRERQRTVGPNFDIEELSWPREGDASKFDRIQRLGPDLRNHRLYLPYGTDRAALTSNQRKMQEQGYDYRIAQPIRRKNDIGELYDLCEVLRLQIHYFPFGGKCDVIDAASRLYDMDPLPPQYISDEALEPEYI